MTKPITEDTISKLNLSTTETNSLFQNSIKILTDNNPSLCNDDDNLSLSKISKTNTECQIVRNKIKNDIIKSRLEKTLNKICNLESDSDPEKTINVDLTSHLYQMENY